MASSSRGQAESVPIGLVFVIVVSVAIFATAAVSYDSVLIIGQGGHLSGSELSQQEVGDMQTVSSVVTGLVGATVLFATGWTIRGIVENRGEDQ